MKKYIIYYEVETANGFKRIHSVARNSKREANETLKKIKEVGYELVRVDEVR